MRLLGRSVCLVPFSSLWNFGLFPWSRFVWLIIVWKRWARENKRIWNLRRWLTEYRRVYPRWIVKRTVWSSDLEDLFWDSLGVVWTDAEIGFGGSWWGWAEDWGCLLKGWWKGWVARFNRCLLVGASKIVLITISLQSPCCS
jgi:hypothetical protein